MKIAVTGANGRLGRELVENRGCIPINCGVEDFGRLWENVASISPDVIIHCAAVTDVDSCESKLFHWALKVNWLGTWNLRQCFDGRIIYLSTDFVFDGENGPYDEWQVPNPINHYGWSKYCGERALQDHKNKDHVIVRTTQLFGGKNHDFVKGCLYNLKKKLEFSLSGDMITSPTYIPHLAYALLCLTRMEYPPKILNIVGDLFVSRYDFGLMIADVFGHKRRFIEKGFDFKNAVKRPKNAGLSVDQAKKCNIPVYSPIIGLQEMKREMEK